MALIFISYNRANEAIVRALAEDLEGLGHTVWFDQELSGGQNWWNQIMAMIRKCDLLIFVLAPKSLNSVACKSEYAYAADVGKPILPLLVANDISTNLLPPALSRIQFVDYRQADRAAVMRLARALATVPPAAPLPDPLPPIPEVPLSYLGNLAERVESNASLGYEQQTAILVDLKRGLRDPETREDARTLLLTLRKRRDLLASIAEEVDELLGAAPRAAFAPPVHQFTQTVTPAAKDIPAMRPEPIVRRAPAMEPVANPAGIQPGEVGQVAQFAPAATVSQAFPGQRRKFALMGFVMGTVIGVAAMFTAAEVQRNTVVSLLGLLTGVAGAIAGAAGAGNRRTLIATVAGAVAGWLAFGIIAEWGAEWFAAGAAYGTLPGTLAGLAVGAILNRMKS